MATQEQIGAARRRLEAKWDDEGSCGSCGWHALLYEHSVDDSDIAEALDNEGGLLLGCHASTRTTRIRTAIVVCVSALTPNVGGEATATARGNL